MQLTFVALLFSALCMAQEAPRSAVIGDLMNQGIAAYKSARYAEATALFLRASELAPSNIDARVYLGTAYMTQYIPGSTASENLDVVTKAENSFRQVLQREPSNVIALQSLASLCYHQAMAAPPEEKDGKLIETAEWNHRLLAAQPDNQEAYYTLGVIAWTRAYPKISAARRQLGMRPEDSGPLTSSTLRAELRGSQTAVIDEGIANVQKALKIDARYDDAMAYLNLLLRLQADLEDTPQAAQQDVALADQWVQRSLDIKRIKASTQSSAQFLATPPTLPPAAPPAPPPLPPPPPPPAGADAPQRIRVGGNVQAANLISRIEPEYPALARQARIEGTVRFNVVIDKEGHVTNAQLISGHPILVQSAIGAVQQFVYKPTLLNGNPVEVLTVIDVNFTLP